MDYKYKCKFCGYDMEHDCSCGSWDKETNHYICVDCGAELTIFENGQEPRWEQNN